MVQIKNTNPLGSALAVPGIGRVEFDAIADVPKELADYLTAGKCFKKASGKTETTKKAAAKNVK